ncbi:RrF2 family transcriptional regulator [Verminephrobacter eiseniae]|uniref:RrF2 family transcriptional regulator n=1 Tax=Verminephrobacter eiseniae TaxID=364317 RepID=UPI00223773F1|nr:Rrf2 family transcriptional regulator [Verminephrobacter eiseniae]
MGYVHLDVSDRSKASAFSVCIGYRCNINATKSNHGMFGCQQSNRQFSGWPIMVHRQRCTAHPRHSSLDDGVANGEQFSDARSHAFSEPVATPLRDDCVVVTSLVKVAIAYRILHMHSMQHPVFLTVDAGCRKYRHRFLTVRSICCEGDGVKSTKFVTACYILSFVTYHGPDMIPTQTIAKWVNVNASRVRQIVARLVRAGLLASTRGGEGGVVIGRAPSDITLLDVFDAVAEQDTALFCVDNPFSDWKDRCRVHSVLTTMRGELERDFRSKLANTPMTSLYAPPPEVHAGSPAKKTVKAATKKAAASTPKKRVPGSARAGAAK